MALSVNSNQHKNIFACLLMALAPVIALPAFAKGAVAELPGDKVTFAPSDKEIFADPALKLDTNLPDLPRKLEKPIPPLVYTNEKAALNQLNQKLYFLEKQLSSLQGRYTALLQNSSPPAPRSREQSPSWQWPSFLFGFVLLSGGMAWMAQRRREYQYQGGTNEAQPTPTDTAASASVFLEDAKIGACDIAVPVSVLPVEPVVEETPPLLASEVNASASQVQTVTKIRGDLKNMIEAFVAKGNSVLAIRLLENHILHEPEESPIPWLLLIDLLRSEKNAARYEYRRLQCQMFFNVAVPPYSNPGCKIGSEEIEYYPHVIAELTRIWPGDEAIPYLDALLYDNRGGSRAGFSFSAYNDIVLLRSIR